MRFQTLSEYDDEIKKIDKMIDNWEKYIKTHPEEIGGIQIAKQNDIKNLKNITEMIESINNSLEKENSQKYLVEINSNYTMGIFVT